MSERVNLPIMLIAARCAKHEAELRPVVSPTYRGQIDEFGIAWQCGHRDNVDKLLREFGQETEEEPSCTTADWTFLWRASPRTNWM